MGGPIHHSYLRPCAASSLSASPSYGVNSLCSRLGAPRGHVGRGVALRVRCDRVIGIDLGTSNSAAAVVMGRSGKPEIVPIDGGHATMPSWVHYSAQGEVTVGRAARKQQHRDPLNTFHSAKRFIGRTIEMVTADAQNVAFTVKKGRAGMAMLHCPALGVDLLPEEISAEVLKKIIKDVEEALGEPVTKAVVTVPAYFNDAQRDATSDAGYAAGLKKVKLLREPQAAALAYGVNRQEDSTVMVFDLGGGTFDVAVLEVGGGAVEVLATGGDAHLGGNDFDSVVMDWLVAEAEKQGVIVPIKNSKAASALLSLSLKARENLSSQTSATITIPTAGDQPNVEIQLTRNTLDKLAADLLRKLRLPMEQCAFQCGVDLAAQGDMASRKGSSGRRGIAMRRRGRYLDEILMVGGATRMPAVRRFVENMTNMELKLSAVNPDEAVALGGAVQAGILEGTVAEGEVVDVWQAQLMRALATARLQEEGTLEQTLDGDMLTASAVGQGGSIRFSALDDDEWDMDADLEEGEWVEEEDGEWDEMNDEPRRVNAPSS